MNNTQGTLLAIVTIILLILLINPFYFYMPTMMVMWILSGLFVVFAAYAVYVWKEQPQDEREEELAAKASRIGFLAGAGVILLAILFQKITMGMIDSWLAGALGAMMVSKIVARVVIDK